MDATVDGWNPAPVEGTVVEIPLFIGFDTSPSQVVVWDFSHQQYGCLFFVLYILWIYRSITKINKPLEPCLDPDRQAVHQDYSPEIQRRCGNHRVFLPGKCPSSEYICIVYSYHLEKERLSEVEYKLVWRSTFSSMFNKLTWELWDVYFQ